MSQSDTPAEKPAGTTDRTALETLPGVIGVDCRGYLHRYDAVQQHLVVTDRDNDVVHERELNADEIHGWIPAVGNRWGWIDCWFDAEHYVDVTGRLARALETLGEEGQR